MIALRIGLNILVPLIILFLVFATWMGYIAENSRDYYDLKWLAIGVMLIGYILQFYKGILGGVLIGICVVGWFML